MEFAVEINNKFSEDKLKDLVNSQKGGSFLLTYHNSWLEKFSKHFLPFYKYLPRLVIGMKRCF